MINKKQFVAVLIAIFATIGVINAQEKYAVIITGDNNAVNVPVADRWNNGQGMGTYGYDEFWNDAYLFWEMLFTEKGYTDENIFVLYDNGYDLTFPLQNDRYNALETYGYNITDKAASKLNVEQLFEGLANGTYGYPQITQEDFIYVWVMSHGGNTQSENDGDAFFYLQNGEKVYDYDLATWTANINANRMVFQLEFPSSGGFRNNLADDDTYIFSSTTANGNSYRCDNSPEVENEVISGITYNHGEFNFHTYSAMMGETPAYATTYNNQPLTDANTNDNQFISFAEAKDWNISENSTSETPQVSGDIGPYSAADYPTLFIENFTTDKTYRGIIGADYDYGPSNNVMYISNNNVRIANNAKATFFNDTQLKINNNGVLTIEDDVEINGYSGSSGIFNYNELYIGNNVYLHGEPTSDWGGIVVSSYETLDLQEVTFQDCYLTTQTTEIAIEDCNFIRSQIYPYVNNLSISSSVFTETLIYIINQNPATGSFRMDDCTLTDSYGNLGNEDGIYINNYDDYSITNCHIEGFQKNGARIVNSGDDINSRILIENNTIINNAISNGYAGLYLVHSHADIHNNYIANNDRGIVLVANSTVKLRGDNTFSPTQEIINNTVHQLWTTDDSFPYYFTRNLLHGANPLPYHIVYMSTQNTVQKDMRRNCWGPDFDPANPQWFFWPHAMLTWNPYWNCNTSSSEEKTDAQLLFESAELKVTNEDYTGAEQDYQSVVQTYPDSKYAKIALRDLFRLEKLTGNDYQELKSFYESNQTIQNNLEMKGAADVLAINCEIQDENYFEALDMLDDFIVSPTTDFNDSVFAIYEQNYIYDMMGNGGLKSTGAEVSHESSFTALKNYDEKQDETLYLLFRDDVRKESLENSLNELKPGMLLQNVPNPFTGSTDIYFKLEVEADVNILIYNHMGQTVRSIPVGFKDKGTNWARFNAIELTPGMYYYVLEINGTVFDSKKMTIMK